MTEESRFSASFSGISRLLRSDMIGRELMNRAEVVMDRAKATAPVSETTDHPGRYRDSFHVKLGLNRQRSRVEAVVYNDAPEALWVEKGTVHNPAYHILTGALDILRRF